MKVGFNAHRLIDDDEYFKKELDFVKTINEEMENSPNLLAQIVGDPDRKKYLGEKEEKIVLSVIQWLGTPVGQNFLYKVYQK